MYFKVLPGCELYDKLMQLQQRIKEARAAAHKIINRFGTKQYIGAKQAWEGGISGFVFDTPPDTKVWKQIYKSRYDNVYFPKATEMDLLAEIKALPIVSMNDLTKILKFGIYSNKQGNKMCTHPGFQFGKGYCLIQTHDWVKWRKPAGVIEITASEYLKLEKGKK